MDRKNRLPPVHPRRDYQGRYLPAVGLSVTAAAKALGVSGRCFTTFLRSANPCPPSWPEGIRLFGSSPEVWMRLQAAYDLKKAEQNKKVMERIARIVPVKPVEEIRA
jgi:plasmid maintenance system antidote protein VapI